MRCTEPSGGISPHLLAQRVGNVRLPEIEAVKVDDSSWPESRRSSDASASDPPETLRSLESRRSELKNPTLERATKLPPGSEGVLPQIERIQPTAADEAKLSRTKAVRRTRVSRSPTGRSLALGPGAVHKPLEPSP